MNFHGIADRLRRFVRAVACLSVVAFAAFGPAAPTADAAVVRLTLDQLIHRLSNAGLRESALRQAMKAMAANRGRIHNARFLTVIDYRLNSSRRRLFVIDLQTGKYQALLVAHGAGSDRDHDGFAERFSNRLGSHMSSIGAYLTGRPYYGKHGLSLRLVGLSPTNDRAMERAIVIHGAAYVSPKRARIGRSWGCPAIERRYVAHLIPKLAGGSFLYIAK